MPSKRALLRDKSSIRVCHNNAFRPRICDFLAVGGTVPHIRLPIRASGKQFAVTCQLSRIPNACRQTYQICLGRLLRAAVIAIPLGLLRYGKIRRLLYSFSTYPLKIQDKQANSGGHVPQPETGKSTTMSQECLAVRYLPRSIFGFCRWRLAIVEVSSIYDITESPIPLILRERIFDTKLHQPPLPVICPRHPCSS